MKTSPLKKTITTTFGMETTTNRSQTKSYNSNPRKIIPKRSLDEQLAEAENQKGIM